jgi:hypothetical protein
MGTDVSMQDYASLYEEAKKHSEYGTFRDEVLRLAENIWHQVRDNGEMKKPGEEDQDDAPVPPET